MAIPNPLGDISNALCREHVQSTHFGDLVCNMCGKILSSHKSWKRHENSHTNPNKFLCPFPECGGLGYDRGDRWGNHIASQHRQEVCNAVAFCTSQRV